MTGTHALYIPAPYQDAVDSGRLILKDGSTATLRVAIPADTAAMRRFFEGLSAESRHSRFLSSGMPEDSLIEFLCDASDPTKRVTLVVTRRAGDADRIVAAASYISRNPKSAEVAFAVEDAFQRMGIGTHLLERLAAIAIRNGFVRFWAMTDTGNRGMLDVFRNSGFPVREHEDGGAVEVEFDVMATASSVELSEIRDRLSTALSIRPFFRPNAVAVIGASRDETSIGYRILDELIRAGFNGPIYPVNPHAETLRGVRAYASTRDVSPPVDMAIVAVPRHAVLGAVDDCATVGVRALVVITAAFSEADETGKELQRQLVQKVRGYGMRMVGPNCMGLLNTDPAVQLNASFSPVFPPAGNLAMSSQSGALGLAVLAFAAERGLGLSTFVSVGNKADVSGNDLLQYWETDNRTRVILLYLESFGNPRRFARIARRVGRTKPIVAVKAGRTHAGKRAAGSHTAALAANDVAVDALFRQTGVIRAETLEELFDIAALLGNQPLLRGRRVAIVTNAGGPGILLADACEAEGLSVPELGAPVQNALQGFLPPNASVANPVDMIASASEDDYSRTIETVLTSGDVDALVAIYIPVDRGDPDRVSKAISVGVERGRAAGATGKPVLACLMTGGAPRHALRAGGEAIPVYMFPESAARVLSKCADYAQWQSAPPGVVPAFDDLRIDVARQIVSDAIERKGSGWLLPQEIQALFDAFRIPLTPGRIAATPDEAAEAAAAFGFPVVVKLVSSTITHKTDVGGVRLNLRSEDEVRQAVHDLSSAEGVLVQKMLSGGVELMMGVTDDPLFGSLIAFGLGGIHVEILRDVRFRVTPLTDKDAREMVREIRGFPLLEGYRGHAPADIESIEDVLLRLSRLVEEFPEITDVDLNPIIALPPGKGCSVVDARVRVATG